VFVILALSTDISDLQIRINHDFSPLLVEHGFLLDRIRTTLARVRVSRETGQEFSATDGHSNQPDAQAEKKFTPHAVRLNLFGLTQLLSRISMFGAAIVLVLRLALA